MQAGRLDRRISIQQREALSPEQSASGEPQSSWGEVCTVWAALEDIAGREFFSAREIASDVSTRFRLRYREGITANMRVVDGDAIYNIEAVIRVGRRKTEMQLMCSTGVNHG